MASGRVPDYLGEGLAADRPEALDLAPGCIGFYRATDTGELSVWSDGAWQAGVTGAAADVAYDNASSGLAATDTQGAIDELAASVAALEAPPAAVASITTATHNLVAADLGKYNRTTYAGAAAVTVQNNSAEAIDVSAEAHFRAVGGALTLTAGSGVTLNAPAGGTLVVPQHGTVTIKKVATNEWDVLGVTVAP